MRPHSPIAPRPTRRLTAAAALLTICGALAGSACDRPSAPAGPAGRAAVDPQREPGAYHNRQHGFFVRFVDDWIIHENADAAGGPLVVAEPPAQPGVPAEARLQVELAAPATGRTPAQSLDESLSAWRTRPGFEELARGQEPLRADSTHYVLFRYRDGDHDRRAIAYLRTDLEPPLMVVGDALAERFPDYAGGFRLTAQSVRKR